MQPFPPISESLNPDQPLIDALVTLHTRTLDNRAGFENMLEKAEPEFRPTVQRFHDLHARQAASIAGILANHGYSADDSGSIMGSINRAVVVVRSWFDEVDADLMTNIRDGEDAVLTAFSEAIAQPLPQDDIRKLTEMQDELVALLVGRSAAT